MDNTFKIQLVTLIQDNGDGGFSVYAYNNKEELLADRYSLKDLEKGSPEWEKKAKEILTGYDEYNNGYIGSSVCEIEIVDGQARLMKPLFFHGGQ